MIGIVSYYPNEKKLRAIRKRNHINQLKFLVNIFPKEIINIVSQNYEEKDYIKHKNINYIKKEKPLGPAEARNIIFKMFYNSDEECLLLMDDDVIWYDYYDATSLVKDFYYNSNKYDFEMLVPLNPTVEPFKKQLYNKNLKDYFTLKKINFGASTCLILIKKVNIYQKSFDKDDKNAISEDMLFLEEFMLKKYKGYKVMNWIKKLSNMNVCSIIETDNAKKSIEWHKKIIDNFKKHIKETYNFKNGVKDFNKMYNLAEKELLVRRVRPYFIEKKVVPKK